MKIACPAREMAATAPRGAVFRPGESWGRGGFRSAGARTSPLLAMPDGERPAGGAGDSGLEAGGTGPVAEGSYHVPVLLQEVVRALRPGPGRVFFDGTLGGGGHSEALLREGATVVACDQDPEAIAHARARLSRYGDRFVAVQGNYSAMDAILASAGVLGVDGILLDLGISSRQVDAPERGFSFQKGGPLDMRMNPAAPLSAADLVNDADEAELARLFWEYGEERASRRIARAIVEARSRGRIGTTLELAGVVESVLPRGGGKHPATRVFQALRMAVNDELGSLEAALAKSPSCLKPGGVLAVISFHSLEDRIVKQFLRRHSEEWIDRPEWERAKPNPERLFKLAAKKPVVASVSEQEANPRSRSAKLRVAERLRNPSNH